MRTLVISLLLIAVMSLANAQQDRTVPDILHRLAVPQSTLSPRTPVSSAAFLSTYKSPKKPGHYTVKDWRALIDSLWGPGAPTATKLQIFDFFWNLIDKQFAGFPYLDVNWDSLKALYRPEVAAGVSRGRFDAIMCQLYFPLQEIHTYIGDSGLDSSFLEGGAFVYKPGIPMFWINGWGPVGNFGAALSPLPDSSLLVYRAIPSHPLGLVPGDIVLGYDGIPWKQLYKDLLVAQLPLQWQYLPAGSTQRSMTYSLLNSAGNNWGLFDTVDVVKYGSGDTVHLATASLAGLVADSLYATDQVPVPGVRMPDFVHGHFISYGVIENTSIGYVYATRWNAADAGPFASAMADLVAVKKVTALILDFRYNLGSADSQSAADAGLDYLFSENPGGPSRWRDAWRNTSGNHLSFTYSAPFDQDVSMRPDFYDRPIAVLTGPHARSMGDLFPFKMRSHPMVRFFGAPTNGSFPLPGTVPFVSGSWGTWYYQHADGQMQSLVNNEGLLMHKGFPVDEEVWLTRDGVANGIDDVARRAIQWIDSLPYAHDVKVDWVSTAAVTPTLPGVLYAASDTLYKINPETGAATEIGWVGPTPLDGLAIRPSTREMYGVSGSSVNTTLYRISASAGAQPRVTNAADSIRITAKVENPALHAIVVSAIVTTGQGSVVDSVVFTKTPGDSLWSAVIGAPTTDGRYNVSVRTDDVTAGSYRILPNLAWFSALTRVERTVPVPYMRAIAFSHGDTLYGATTNGSVYRIDLTTGQVDSVGRARRLVYSGLAFSPTSGKLWASVRTPIDSIFTLNTTTGAATFVGVTGFHALTSSIAFGPDGTLLGLIYNGSSEHYLASIDTITAAGTLIAGPLVVKDLHAIAMRTDSLATSVDQHPIGQIPKAYALGQNYPNPFNPATMISYQLPSISSVSLKVFDVLGREVATLVNEKKQPGEYSVQWNAANVPSGVYFYRIAAAEASAGSAPRADSRGFVQTRKMILIK